MPLPSSEAVAAGEPSAPATPQPGATPLAQEAAALGITEPTATGETRLEPGRARLVAGRVRKEGNIVTVEGEDGRPVVVESGDVEAGGTRIQAQSVRIDTSPGAPSLQANGQVRLERSRIVVRRATSFGRNRRRDITGRTVASPSSEPGSGESIGSSGTPNGISTGVSTGDVLSGSSAARPGVPGGEFFKETLTGESLVFNGRTRRGSLDGAELRLSTLDIAAANILIEGGQDGQGGSYQARQVVIRPGGLTERERQIYGTPPFSLRARSVNVGADSASGQGDGRVVVRGAGLYFRNTRLLPVPLQVLAPFGLVRPGSSRAPSSFSIVPRLSLNSTDRFLLSTRISLALSGFGRSEPGASGSGSNGANAGAAGRASRLGATSLNLDLGISGRLGFRGGLSLENRSPLGLLALRARRADVVTTQLTNRIELNRFPEVSFDSPLVPLLSLGRGRGVGAFASGAAGRLSERTVGSSLPRVESGRLSGTVGLTTRLDGRDGLYADLFATRSSYSLNNLSYTNTGFEIGYLGRILPQVRGLFSLRRTGLSGTTPFRFDLVEIPREFRTTFDIEATPRYLIPIDLRYDLDRRTLRDKSVGVLRNYKTFAYGVVYQAARRDLRLELRSSF